MVQFFSAINCNAPTSGIVHNVRCLTFLLSPWNAWPFGPFNYIMCAIGVRLVTSFSLPLVSVRHTPFSTGSSLTVAPKLDAVELGASFVNSYWVFSPYVFKDSVQIHDTLFYACSCYNFCFRSCNISFSPLLTISRHLAFLAASMQIMFGELFH